MREKFFQFWVASILGVILGPCLFEPIYWFVFVIFLVAIRKNLEVSLFVLLGAISFFVSVFSFESWRHSDQKQVLSGTFAVVSSSQYNSQLVYQTEGRLEGLQLSISQVLEIGQVCKGSLSIYSAKTKESTVFPPHEWTLLARNKIVRGRPTKNWSCVGNSFQAFNEKPDRTEGFIASVFKGSYSGISKESWEALHFLGLSHLFIISGTHLGIFVLLVSFFVGLFLRAFPLKRSIEVKIILSFIIVSLFVFSVQSAIPVSRAYVLFFVCYVCRFCCPQLHRYQNAEILSFVGCIWALAFPLDVFSRSYLFSFGIAWSLLSLYENKKSFLSFGYLFYPFYFVLSIGSLFGGLITWLSPLFNLFIGGIFFSFILPVSMIGSFFNKLRFASDAVLSFFFESLKFWASFLEMHKLYFSLEQSEAIIFLVVVIVSLTVQRLTHQKVLHLGLWSILVVFSFFPGKASQSFQTQVLDVGQGDGLLIKRRFQEVFIDGGKSADVFRSFVRRGSMSTDHWVLSHFDQDHSGAFESSAFRLAAKNYYIPYFDQSLESRLLQKFDANIVHDGSKTLFCDAVYCFEVWMNEKTRRPPRPAKNSASLVLIVYHKASRVLHSLWLGDLPKLGERRLLAHLRGSKYRVPDEGIELLKAGHHGSASSSSEGLFEFVRPKIVILNVGRSNRYRFPRSSVLDRMEAWGCIIRRTDSLGAFSINF